MITNCINTIIREYRAIPHLDTYEGFNLDNEEYESMSPGTRAEVERKLRKRDRQEALASGRTRPGLLYDEGSDDFEDMGPSHARRRIERPGDEGMEFDQVEMRLLVDFSL